MSKHKVENNMRGSSKLDLTGQRFGKLQVLHRDGSDKNMNKVWKCECDCGTECSATTASLRTGNITSCGCSHYSSKEERYNWTGFKDISGAKWYSVKDNAEKRGLLFAITKEDIWDTYVSQGMKCALSGVDISFKDKTASIDRIDSTQGYIVNNVQIVHKHVNIMKNNFKQSYFISMCINISRVH